MPQNLNILLLDVDDTIPPFKSAVEDDEGFDDGDWSDA